MIRETVGNIIKAKESILVFRGRKEQVFSGSVGKQVRDELVDPVMILSIQEAADESKLPFYLFESENGNYLAAVFAEDAATLKTALEAIRRLAHNRSIAIPGYLGKDWDETFSIILEVFRDYRSDVTVYYTEDNLSRLKWEYTKEVPCVADRDAGGWYLLRPWHGFPAMTSTLDIVHWFSATFANCEEPEDSSNQEDAAASLQKDAACLQSPGGEPGSRKVPGAERLAGRTGCSACTVLYRRDTGRDPADPGRCGRTCRAL